MIDLKYHSLVFLCIWFFFSYQNWIIRFHFWTNFTAVKDLIFTSSSLCMTVLTSSVTVFGDDAFKLIETVPWVWYLHKNKKITFRSCLHTYHKRDRHKMVAVGDPRTATFLGISVSWLAFCLLLMWYNLEPQVNVETSTLESPRSYWPETHLYDTVLIDDWSFPAHSQQDHP